jgi:hypothetical protein
MKSVIIEILKGRNVREVMTTLSMNIPKLAPTIMQVDTTPLDMGGIMAGEPIERVLRRRKRRKLRKAIENQEMFEMSNLIPKNTGLRNVVWVSYKGKIKHGPRIKVVVDRGDKVTIDNMVTVTISDDPKVIGRGLKTEDAKLVREFILKNKGTLLDYWEGHISTSEMIGKIQKLN